MSGYDIKKALEGSASNFWAESYGQLYPILKRLSEEGLVRPVAGPAGARGKRVFESTAAGRKALDAWLVEPTEMSTVRNEFLLKLFFGKRASPHVLRRHLEQHRAEQQRLLEHYEVVRRGLEASFPDSEDMPFWRITLRYGEHDRRALIDWCDETLEELGRIEASRGPAKKEPKTTGRASARTRGDTP